MSSILTNTSAMVALQTLRGLNTSMAKTQDEISTGKTVGSAKDNASVWAISKVMEADVKGFKGISDSLGLGESTVAVARQASETITDLLTDIKGKVVAAQEQNVDREKIQADIDATFTTGEPTITGLIPSTSSEGINMVALIVPVRADPAAAEVGAPGGVLVGFLNVERLGRSFSSAFAIAETDTSAAVVDGEQVIISQTNTDNPDEALVSDLAAPIAAAVGGIRSNLTYTSGGIERVAVFAPVLVSEVA